MEGHWISSRTEELSTGPIQSNSTTTEECLTAMLTDWLNKAYDTVEHGEPTWQKLAEAVCAPAGGNNPALANSLPPIAVVTTRTLY